MAGKRLRAHYERKRAHLKKRLFAALCLLAGALFAACDSSTPVPTPTAVTSAGPTSTPNAMPISEVFLTDTPTIAAPQPASPSPTVGAGPGGGQIEASPVVTSSAPVT